MSRQLETDTEEWLGNGGESKGNPLVDGDETKCDSNLIVNGEENDVVVDGYDEEKAREGEGEGGGAIRYVDLSRLSKVRIKDNKNNKNNENNDKNNENDNDSIDYESDELSELSTLGGEQSKVWVWLDGWLDWCGSVWVGGWVVSFWRGAWTLLDGWLCDQSDRASLAEGTSFCLGFDDDRRWRSAVGVYVAGWLFLIVGVLLVWTGQWNVSKTTEQKQPKHQQHHHHHRCSLLLKKPQSFLRMVRHVGTVYVLGLSAVCLWRGIWYATDHLLLPNMLTDGSSTYGLPIPLISYWVSSIGGAALCFLLNAGGSMLAPPAIFLLDGPSTNPPLLAVTVLSSYYAVSLPAAMRPPHIPLLVIVLDCLVSFAMVPVGVVNFWRGTWMLLDVYLWKFAPTFQSVNRSLGYGTVVAVVCLVLTSEPVISRISNSGSGSGSGSNHKQRLAVMARLRTFLLGVGTVSFWRVVWYLWDQYWPGRTSALLSHVAATVGLLLMGCLSSVAAPPSTIGIDTVPHPAAAEEPLFHMLPLARFKLCVLGILAPPPRQPPLRPSPHPTKPHRYPPFRRRSVVTTENLLSISYRSYRSVQSRSSLHRNR